MSFFKHHIRWISLLLLISFSGVSGLLMFGVEVYAWTKMTQQFLKKDTPRVALKKTFDEKHPCYYCKHLRAARAKEAKAMAKEAAPNHATIPLRSPSLRMEALHLARLREGDVKLQNPHEFKSQRWVIQDLQWWSQFDSPPTPPPKVSATS